MLTPDGECECDVSSQPVMSALCRSLATNTYTVLCSRSVMEGEKRADWVFSHKWCKTSYTSLPSLSPCTAWSPAHHEAPAPPPCATHHLPSAPCCCLSRWRTVREQGWHCHAPSSSSRCCRCPTAPLHHTPYPVEHLDSTYGKTETVEPGERWVLQLDAIPLNFHVLSNIWFWLRCQPDTGHIAGNAE